MTTDFFFVGVDQFDDIHDVFFGEVFSLNENLSWDSPSFRATFLFFFKVNKTGFYLFQEPVEQEIRFFCWGKSEVSWGLKLRQQTRIKKQSMGNLIINCKDQIWPGLWLKSPFSCVIFPLTQPQVTKKKKV